MFSYLHGIRPNNRRSSSHNSIPQPHLIRQYHGASTTGKEIHYEPLPDRGAIIEGSSPLPSSVSPGPPILPPIPRIASQHGSSGRIDLELQPPDSISSKLNEQQKAHQDVSVTTIVDGNALQTSRDVPKKFSRRVPQQPPYQSPAPSHDGAYRPLNTSHESKRLSETPTQNVLRPISVGNPTNIRQPRRPPPPPPPPKSPPIHSSQPEVSNSNSSRHGRTKLNILNPMLLLARRRSSQADADATLDKAPQSKSPGISSIGLPDDYDPRIRGKMVHDFSAPRQERKYASNETALSGQMRSKTQELPNRSQYRLSPNFNSYSSLEEDSPNSADREHTPIFKEHFDDDIDLDLNMRSRVAKHGASAFVYQVSLTESHPDPDPSSIPAFARNLPPRVSSEIDCNYPSNLTPKTPFEVNDELSQVVRPLSDNSIKSSPPVSPPQIRSRAPSDSDSPFQPAGLPRRFKSNASRFSFDLAGVGSSAQEKLLEEKHRLRAKQSAKGDDPSARSLTDESFHDADDNDDDDGYNYEDIDDEEEDGIEEKIPGVNADDGNSTFPVLNRNMESFNFLPTTISSPNSPNSLVNIDDSSPPTPRDNQGQPIGFAISRSSPNLEKRVSPHVSARAVINRLTDGIPPNPKMEINSGIRSLSLEDEDTSSTLPNVPLAGLPLSSSSQHHYQDDDFYFDDGMIEDLEELDGAAFDESVFDDDTSRNYSLPSRDREPISLDYNNNAHQKETLHPYQKKVVGHSHPSECNDRLDTSTGAAQSEERDPFSKTAHENRTSFVQTADLTQDNLAAYHDALAFATNQAALNGEFNRRQSPVLQNGDGDLDGLAGMASNDERNSQKSQNLIFNPAAEGVEDFDFDDELSDDPIIAAANAEALENDDEGFYGQEFGFFARATGSGEYANGGYFGPRGVEGIGRSHSGRVNFQEPSLTPITERSEWSNRNSAISLSMLGYPQPAQPAVSSPGLAQLADMLPFEEENMSLSALMKLRRGAWGGSTTSLQSSSGSQLSGSPLNVLPTIPSSTEHATNPVHVHNFTSTYSLTSSSGLNSGSDSDHSPSSPTVTVSFSKPAPHTTSTRSESSPNLPLSLHNLSNQHTGVTRPRSSHLAGKTTGHSRNSSGAESVSYVHEKDIEGSGGRWVVEKRRLGENGKVEVLEREILEGGSI